MKPLNAASPEAFSSVRFLLTDMDETLTFRGRLAGRTYTALERLQTAGVTVIPVTAAPAGWCDQMARMWPVDGVIGENGGLFIRRSSEGVDRTFWTPHQRADQQRALAIAGEIAAHHEDTPLADDQPFRLATVAFRASGQTPADDAFEHALREAGLDTAQNNLWVLAWLGGFDKLRMARRVLSEIYGLDIEHDGDAVIYVGDSANDAPMFSFFRHTVGVSTVRRHLDRMAHPPAWVTEGPGGAGFVEVADVVIEALSSRQRAVAVPEDP